MAVTNDRYYQNGINELTELMGKIDILLKENNAEIDYEKVIFEQNGAYPKANITIQLA